jgi:bla regulator protein BlaR1
MMLAKYFSDVWTAVAPAIGNHLWQSTLFAVVAGLLTLMLRKNQALARYWIWLAASLKFLIPFSLLVAAGNHLGWWRSSDGVETGITLAMDQISQPFTQPAMPAVSHTAPAVASPFASSLHLLPLFLAALWLCGFAAVLFIWFVHWRQMSGAIRNAVPLDGGREVVVLRRMESVSGERKRIQMFLSSASLEPGIFGIVRPVLVWPEGISARLEDVHVEAILAHELGHVRRRDNLFAAVHMVVEAIFWFHPLVWFLGTRLVEEREVACDEEVLELGSERQVYAESILKICEFCVGSPLACVSGVTGADLKKRIVRIMTPGVTRKLDLGKKILLSAATLAAVTTPLVAGLMNAPRRQDVVDVPSYRYEVSTIKPNNTRTSRFGPGFTADGYRADFVPLMLLIRQAYGVQGFQVAGGSAWINTEFYNVEAKMDGPTAEALRKLRPDRLKLARQKMLQSLLEERFGLKVHRGTKDGPVYLLEIAKGGSKLHESKPDDDHGVINADGAATQGYAQKTSTGIIAYALSTLRFATLLSQEVKRPVVDKTGLTGTYDFTLDWDRDLAVSVPHDGDESGGAPDPGGASIFTAVQQLGLKLEPGKGPVEIIVIDHAERPSGN